MISIYRQRHKRPIETDSLHQLLLGLSLFDILATLSIMTAVLMLPTGELEDIPWAFGNDATCTASGFLYVLWLRNARCSLLFVRSPLIVGKKLIVMDASAGIFPYFKIFGYLF